MPREVVTDWVTPAGGGFRTVMFFSEFGPIADLREALSDFWDSCSTSLDTNVNWTIETSGRIMDHVTGTLTGVWNESTVQTGGGANSGNVVPDATQGLVRWNTDQIVNGRFLKGRNYIPGFSTAAVSEGNMLAANRTAINAGATALIATGVEIGVWHRPVGGAGGAFHVATSADVWSEFAVLRQRRA